jgi:hypothetical protein
MSSTFVVVSTRLVENRKFWILTYHHPKKDDIWILAHRVGQWDLSATYAPDASSGMVSWLKCTTTSATRARWQVILAPQLGHGTDSNCHQPRKREDKEKQFGCTNQNHQRDKTSKREISTGKVSLRMRPLVQNCYVHELGPRNCWNPNWKSDKIWISLWSETCIRFFFSTVLSLGKWP